jgi:hypothetical protein
MLRGHETIAELRKISNYTSQSGAQNNARIALSTSNPR